MTSDLTHAFPARENTSDHRRDDIEDLINAIPALVARIDCNMHIRYANQCFRKWFPYTDHSSDSFPVVVGKHIFNQVQRHLGKVLTGTVACFNISFDHDGEHFNIDVNLSPYFDSHGQITSLIFHGTDVTEKFNEQRTLYDYLENATIGLHWVNSKGLIIWANPAELKMLGYEPDEYIGQHISKIHKNPDCINDILTRLSRGEILKNYEAELVCKDGTTKYVSINSSVLWEGRRFVHTRCFTIDITAQKLAAEAAKESEQRFKIMADIVPVIIWTTDENGLCTFLNSNWKELTGKDVSHGLGNQWLKLVHSDDSENVVNSWNKSLSGKSVFEVKCRILNGKGEATVCYINSLPRFDSNNTFTGYTGIIQDFSSQDRVMASLEKMVLVRTNDLRLKNLELSKAEQTLKIQNKELEKINNELSSFAHVASHDLQEPLRKIQFFTDTVIKSEGDKLSGDAKRFLQKIENASTRMRHLIQDILLYSRTSNAEGKMELVDFNQLVHDVISEFEVKIEERNAIIETTALPTLPVIRFQFHQLFLNLISNALKFSKATGRPHIKISSCCVKADEVPGVNVQHDFIKISVEDNGIGFEAEYSERIFEMFNRLHSGVHFEGTGIGLAICKKIVELHNGKMMADSKPNEGAVFVIYLPAPNLVHNE